MLTMYVILFMILFDHIIRFLLFLEIIIDSIKLNGNYMDRDNRIFTYRLHLFFYILIMNKIDKELI